MHILQTLVRGVYRSALNWSAGVIKEEVWKTFVTCSHFNWLYSMCVSVLQSYLSLAMTNMSLKRNTCLSLVFGPSVSCTASSRMSSESSLLSPSTNGHWSITIAGTHSSLYDTAVHTFPGAAHDHRCYWNRTILIIMIKQTKTETLDLWCMVPSNDFYSNPIKGNKIESIRYNLAAFGIYLFNHVW